MSSPTVISNVEGNSKEHPRVETVENGISPSNTDVVFAPESEKQRTLTDRLGLVGLITLVGGTIVILIVVALQVVLWQYGNYLDENNKLGSAIAHSDVTARFVTLSSMVVRIIVALQAGVCTSIAAALLLEGGGVPLPDVLRFAAVRSLNGGPTAILLPMQHQLSFYLRSAPAVAIIIIFITSSAIQLESTVLLSDFKSSTIEGHLRKRDVSLASSLNNSASSIARMTKIDYWGSRPSVYTPFGEIKETGYTGSDVHDSGATFHGMLPFEGDADRKLRRYDGATTVFGTRVACAAPEIHATVEYSTDGFFTPYLAGNASFPSSMGPLSCEDDPQGQAPGAPSRCILPFNCTLPVVNPSNTNGYDLPPTTEWTLAICAVGQSIAWQFDKTFFGTIDQFDDNWTTAVLIINRTQSDQTLSHDERPRLNVTTPLSTNGEWATFNLTYDGDVDLTMCFSKLVARAKYVEMRTSEATQQGTIDWDERDSKYDTSSVRKLLNSEGKNLTNQERGILNMQFPAFDESTLPEHSVTDFRQAIKTSLWPQRSVSGGVSMSIFTCLLCYGSRETTVNIHPFLASLFDDTVKQTRHPALALQAVFQSISQMAYYEEFPSFTVKYPAKLLLPLTTSIPRQWIGFGIVTGIVWAHLILVAWMTLMFARRTKHSIIGEVWQSVGQVVSGMSEQVLKQGVRSTDEEIRKSCKDTGVDRDVVGVSSGRAIGGIEVQERKKMKK